MAKIHPEKLYLIERRNRIIWQLDLEGYSNGDISDIMRIENSWITRIIQRRPRGWQPTIEKAP